MLPLSVEALVSLLISLRPISLWGLLPLPEMGRFLIMGLKMTCFFKLVCPTNNPTLLKRNNSQKSKRAKESSNSRVEIKSIKLHIKVS